jgi:NitT/TauT family transport system substrate-binding protein
MMPRRIDRCAALGALVAATALAAAALAPFGGGALAETPIAVRIGTPNVASDAPIYIAVEKGYFAKQDITPLFVSFSSAVQMIAPLAAGQIDVGAGGVSAGLYNAVGRGVGIRAVADKVRLRKGSRYIDLVIRNDLIDSGRFKGPKDLKGLIVAEGGRETTTSPTLAMMAQQAGITYDDFTHPVLPFADQVTALANHSIDAGVMVEPNITKTKEGGLGSIVTSINDAVPNVQIAVLLYSEHFAKDKNAAQRFMNAYLEGTRYYADAIIDGRLVGPNAADVISILVKYTNLKSADLYRRTAPSELDADGRIDVDSLNDSLRFFQKRNVVKDDIDINSMVDSSFARASVDKLGRYKPTH